MNDDSTFGARFVRTWQQLQAFLAHLDPEELEQLASCDMAQTIALLERQPELGASSMLIKPMDPPVAPELLAIAMVRERLQAVDPPSDPDGFGARFLQAWREAGGLLSNFRYTEIQELKAADRVGTLRILAPLTQGLSTVDRRQLAAATPESLVGILRGVPRVNQHLHGLSQLQWLLLLS